MEIGALQADGCMTNLELAAKINLSPSPCLRCFRNLEKSEAILGRNAEVDVELYGLSVTVFVQVRLARHTEEEVLNFENPIKNVGQVLGCFIMTGKSDYLLRVIVADFDDYERFVRKNLHSIGSIAYIDTSFVYGVLKQTTIFSTVETS